MNKNGFSKSVCLRYQLKADNMVHYILPFQRGDCRNTSESDVCRRQTLTAKDDPRTEHAEGIKKFRMAVDP